MSKILLDGKKATAQHIVYGALEGIIVKDRKDPMQTLKKALDNIRPDIEVKSRRVGGATAKAWEKLLVASCGRTKKRAA